MANGTSQLEFLNVILTVGVFWSTWSGLRGPSTHASELLLVLHYEIIFEVGT